MTTKDQVINLHARYPNWSAAQIAAHLGCTPEYVRATRSRNGLTTPRISPADAQALGRACIDAGITLRDILDISERKRRS
jgi:hypothetical protein